MRWRWGPLCTTSTLLLDFYSAGALKQHSADRHVTRTHYHDSEPSNILNAAFFGAETTRDSFTVLCLIRSGLEPMIYRTRGWIGKESKSRIWDAFVELLSMAWGNDRRLQSNTGAAIEVIGNFTVICVSWSDVCWKRTWRSDNMKKVWFEQIEIAENLFARSQHYIVFPVTCFDIKWSVW